MAGLIYVHPNQESTGEILQQNISQKKQKTIYLVSNREQSRSLERQIGQSDVEWMTMDQWVVRLMGGQPKITAVEQCAIVQQELRRLVEKGELRYFNQENCFQMSWIEMLVDFIEEIKRAHVLPQRLKRLWKRKEVKLRDFALIYEEYQDRLKVDNLLDHPEMYIQLIRKLSQLSSLLPERVVIEGFPHLYPIQEQLLIQLVTLGVTVELHVVADPLRRRLFQETFAMIERLEKRGFLQRFDYLSKPIRSGKDPALAFLTKHAFGEEVLPSSVNPQAIQVISAEGMEAEVEQLVVHLKQYLLESQVPYRDVAIISSQLGEYRELLHLYLERAGIPVAEDWKQKLTDHPLWQTIIALFQVRHGHVNWLGVLEESPFLPFRHWRKQMGQIPVDVTEWMQWAEKEWEQEGPDPAQLFEWIKQIPKQLSWEKWLTWFSEWIQPLHPLKQFRSTYASQELEQLAEALRAWQSLQQLLTSLQKIAHGTKGQSELTWRRFIDWLGQTAEQIEINKRPAQKGGIRFLSAELTHGYVFRAVFLLGCVDGKWPRAYYDHLLVPDRERAQLRHEGIYLLYSSELGKRQLISFYRSLMTAKDRVYFFYTHADEKGNRQLPSPYLVEALQIFRNRPMEKSFSADEWTNWSTCYSPAKGREFALRLLSQDGESTRSDDREIALQVLESWKQKSPTKWRSLLERIKVERLRMSSIEHPFQGQISDPILLQQIKEWMDRKIWNPTELNHLVECPFRFMAQYLWKVNQGKQQAQGISAAKQDHLLRKVLVRILEHRKRERPLQQLSLEELLLEQKKASQILEQYLKEIEITSPFHFELDRQRIEQSLYDYLSYEYHLHMKQGYQLTPKHLQLAFGQEKRRGDDPHSIESPVSLRLSEGMTIQLQGRIDRIDQDSEGNTILYLYRSKIYTSSKEIMEGQDLSLPLYIKVLEQQFAFPSDQLIGAAYYTKRKKGTANPRNTGLWREEKKKEAKLHVRTTALEREEWKETFQRIGQLLESKWKQVQKGDCLTSPTWDCSEYCPQKTICRAYRQAREGE
jgi:ATP-dependent helicase/nuclease subunit B